MPLDEDDATSDGSAAAPPSGPPFDAGEGGLCAPGLAAGSLQIDELMIASTSGTGDHGEWVEVRSVLDCAVDLRGLTGDRPVGAKVMSFAIARDLWIPARGTFIVAGFDRPPAINHDLPGTVVSWSGAPGDVLRNEGATVTLLFGGAIVNSCDVSSTQANASALRSHSRATVRMRSRRPGRPGVSRRRVGSPIFSVRRTLRIPTSTVPICRTTEARCAPLIHRSRMVFRDRYCGMKSARSLLHEETPEATA